MSTILAYATNADSDTGSYFEHAARAARECLDRAGISPAEVGALINVGVYRDSNIVEPAVAALVQKKIEMGLRYETGGTPSFSFDLLNGACGLLDAIAVADSFFAAGNIDYMLITAGDAHPSTATNVDGFPYANTGAALLLSRTGQAGGFGALHAASETGPIEPVGLVNLAHVGTEGRSTITVDTSRVTTVAHAVAAVGKCVAAENLDLASTLLLVPAPTPDFATQMAEALELPRTSVISVPASVGDPHTAALIYAYENAAETGALTEHHRNVLFVAASGSTAACISYRPQL